MKLFHWFLIFLVISGVYAEDPLYLQEPRELWEPDNILPRMLFDNEYQHTDKTKEYVTEYFEKVEQFLSKYENNRNDALFDSLLGIWNLYDGDDMIERDGWNESAYRFYINKYNNQYVYYIGGTKSRLYLTEDNQIYFLSPWWKCLYKMKVRNDKIYLYYLELDNWKLNEIHDGGKYFYFKKYGADMLGTLD
jgi:hypothetical protein